jgi:hypothetical protein
MKRGTMRMNVAEWEAQCAKVERWQVAPRPQPGPRQVNAGARAAVPEVPSPGAAPAPSKYRNKPTGGYASKREAQRAAELGLMLKAGTIRNLRAQVPYILIPKQDGERACSYLADFVYAEPIPYDGLSPAWGEVVEDCKGYRTEVYRIKRKLMLMVHGIRIRET